MSLGSVEWFSRVIFLDRQNICYTLYEPRWEKVSSNIVHSMKSLFQDLNVLVHGHVGVQLIEPLQGRLVSDWVQTISVCLGQSFLIFIAMSSSFEAFLWNCKWKSFIELTGRRNSLKSGQVGCLLLLVQLQRQLNYFHLLPRWQLQNVLEFGNCQWSQLQSDI